jgi:hypothetical protein
MIQLSIKLKSINFCNGLYVQLLCEFVILSKYDEMNCNFVYGFFYNVLWGVDSGYMK